MRRGEVNRKDKDLPVKQCLGKGRQGGREWLRVSGGRLGWLVVDWDGFGRLGIVKVGRDLCWEGSGFVLKR